MVSSQRSFVYHEESGKGSGIKEVLQGDRKMRYMKDITIGDLVDIKNESDGTWTGPYEVMEYGQKNDFIAGGKVDVLYLQQPATQVGNSLAEFQVVTMSVFANRAIRRRDGLVAFTYPEALCRLAVTKQNSGSS